MKIDVLIKIVQYNRDLKRKKNSLRKEILDFYRTSQNKEINMILKYIKKNGISVFNYPFQEKYRKRKNKIIKDKGNGLLYVIHNGKRMYFKRTMSKKEVNRYYNSVCMEQDEKSPHLYIAGELKEFSGKRVLDVGAAEGNFALSIIDYVSEVFIFEPDIEWIEALQATFQHYKDKVHIIKKYVSDTISDDMITLDSFFKNKEDSIDLIKMDIEGEEVKALKGSKNILKINTTLQLLVCAYHREEDEEEIKKILDLYEIKVRTGWMVFLYDRKLREPYFRRGVMLAKRKEK